MVSLEQIFLHFIFYSRVRRVRKCRNKAWFTPVVSEHYILKLVNNSLNTAVWIIEIRCYPSLKTKIIEVNDDTLMIIWNITVPHNDHT